jgi:hypothetical protein
MRDGAFQCRQKAQETDDSNLLISPIVPGSLDRLKVILFP